MTEVNIKIAGLEKEVARLTAAIRKVVEEGVQITDGPYSPKNNQCKHGRYGFEGCEACVDEYLAGVLKGNEP